MNPYGYSQGKPEPYYPSQMEMDQARNAYLYSTSSHPTAAGSGLPQAQVDTAKHGFQSNYGLIPGLGVGLPRAAGEGAQQPRPQPSPNAPVTTSNIPNSHEVDRSIGGGFNGPTSGGEVAQPDDASEEGELSEGELEDFYDPESVATSQKGAANPRTQAYQTVETLQDRSGSYSPYLSPHEISSTRPASVQAQQTDQSTPITPNTTSSPQVEIAREPSEGDEVEARKHAQDTILRLWPLNIRYQDYLREGLDENILQGLFQDLGLDIAAAKTNSAFELKEANSSTLHQEAPLAAPEAAKAVEKSHPKSGDKPTSTTSGFDVSAPPEKSQTEERKDRIARLLAAKKNSAPPIPENPKPVAPAPRPPPTKTAAEKSAEKSKLLQQKMEALKKAREEKSREALAAANRLQEATSQISNNVQPTLPQLPRAETLPAQQIVDVENGDDERSSSTPEIIAESADGASGSHLKRPMASDLYDGSDSPFKRPFGQARQAQAERFLIHVSDDEDDEEAAMEIDSPELSSAPLHRASSPFKIPSLPMPLNSSTPRDLPSPGITISTPSGSLAGGSNGHVDLESMNKQIEMMKRKIAEAEARKRVKLSRTESPSIQHSSASQNESSESSNEHTPKPVDTPSASVERNELVGATSPLSKSPDIRSRRLPKPSENRRLSDRSVLRQRSRAASERLPLVEAHRREQLQKLQALQAQVQQMENEIAKSLEEESKLRNEAAYTDSEPENPPERASLDSAPVSEHDHVESVESASAEMEISNEEHVPEKESHEDTLANMTTEKLPFADVTANESSTDEANTEMPDIESEYASSDRMDEGSSSSEAEYEPEAESEVQDTTVVINEGLSHEGPELDTDPQEPEQLDESTVKRDASKSPSFSPDPILLDGPNDASDNEAVAISSATPLTQTISTGQVESAVASPREEQQKQPMRPLLQPKRNTSGFVPYDSPLKYFHAYRLHPDFKDAVPGGMRSMTYSHKIDVNTQICPDQLAGNACPRGGDCDFQHFESMQVPDDQILLQLGSYGNYEGEQKREFNEGLRQLLTDFRNRKVKDFQTLSDGIIEYRTKFLGDKSKILPIGSVSL